MNNFYGFRIQHIFYFLVFVLSCDESSEPITKFETLSVIVISPTSATISGKIFELSKEEHNDFGFLYSKSENLSAIEDTIRLGTSPEKKTYQYNLTNLFPATKYYVSFYVMEGDEIFRGDTISFTTLSTFPYLKTQFIQNIDTNSAQCGGLIISDCGSPIISKGICWGTSMNPTLNNNYTIDETDSNMYICQMTGLNKNTYYYVRTYAINANGTNYGNSIYFSTKGIPFVSGLSFLDLDTTFATFQGNVMNDGGYPVLERGICWSLSNNPSLQDNFSLDSSGLGVFISHLSGLSINTTYYTRGYATNLAGTVYGSETNFKTLNTTFTDPRDGHIYRIIKIGTQIWMAENLDYKTPSGSCYYYNTPGNNGRLYNWNTALTASPPGWRLPSNSDWNILTCFLGGSEEAFYKLIPGGSSGFNARPAGFGISYEGSNIYNFSSSSGSQYWSSDVLNSFYPWYYAIQDTNNPYASLCYQFTYFDVISIRCIRN